MCDDDTMGLGCRCAKAALPPSNERVAIKFQTKETAMNSGKLKCLGRGIQPWVLAAILCGPGLLSVSAATNPPAIDARADELLRRAGDYLAEAPFFSVNAEVWQDAVLDSGLRVQGARTVSLEVRRPNKFHAEVHSSHRNREMWYDSKSIAILDRNRNLYGVTAAPGSLDAMLDFVTEKLGIAMPLDDLVESNPYAKAIQNVSSGTYLGPTTVLGVACEHLAFTQTNIDWQIWIQDGPKPVPVKIVITYKDEDGSPQYTALLSKWDFETKLPDFVFNFEVPPQAQKIDIMELKPPASQATSRKEQ
ncbi:MAG: hypothetical protein JWR26_103 [Pedosphaera sp.]|nr:hypothetical protein [Pedosphaera sp.]